MKPRRLKILRIDDSLPVVAATRNALGLGALSLDAPPGVDLEIIRTHTGQISGINGWDTAILYWSEWAGLRSTDLIVADVRFSEDLSSPLNSEGTINEIPTGLSHLKPFAAIARAAGAPIGIGLHTMDPSTWESRWREKDARSRTLALLAAHEVGEIAAILGDGRKLLELGRTDRLDWCWRWLSEHSAANFTQGYKVALEDYRRRFVRGIQIRGGSSPDVMVLPSAWLRSVRWCEDMRKNPRPLGESDPGVEFVLRNGKTDTVQLRSLFADVTVIDLERDTLPAECFETALPRLPQRREVNSWSLLPASLPRIGAFVAAVGVLHDVVELAWNTIAKVPLRLNVGDRIADNLRGLLAGASAKVQLARGLTVLFQTLRRDRENFRVWQDAYVNRSWNRRTYEFHEEYADSDSLEAALGQLFNLMRGEREAFRLDDVLDDCEWGGEPVLIPVPEYVRWHVDLLASAGVLTRNEANTTYRLTGQHLRSTPPLPVSRLRGLDFVGEHLKSYLRDTLGFGETFGPNKTNNDNAVGQDLARAFVGSDNAGEGTDFLNSFLDGDAPSWVKELCRDVLSSKLGWTEIAEWPRAVR